MMLLRMHGIECIIHFRYTLAMEHIERNLQPNIISCLYKGKAFTLYAPRQ